MIVTKSMPWTPASALALSNFFKTDLGENFLCQLNLHLSASQARACYPSDHNPAERVASVFGKQQLLGFILHLAHVEPEPQSNELTDEELNDIVNQMANMGPVIEDII